MKQSTAIIIAALLGCLWLGNLLGIKLTAASWQKDAIEQGVAGYHAQTGEWQWQIPECKSTGDTQ